MKKTRVYQIAEEVGMSNKDILAKIKELGIEVENEKSELEEDDVELILDLIKEEDLEDTHFDDTISSLFATQKDDTIDFKTLNDSIDKEYENILKNIYKGAR